ncbi:hypothetical protein GCM10011578_042010 [Streptomyces fuscichromogenes]|uniref:Uncharacterized protein n=1 Tax=Streptomyces fuscichromogenes TaxID=1324013 RepID=A0A917XDU7_9ACTN|nr:hypothetical protein GCM10011578_042010 [Streptomyces fuscichromogenes]
MDLGAVARHLELAVYAVDVEYDETGVGVHDPYAVRREALAGVPVAGLVLLAGHQVALGLRLGGQVAPAAEAGAAVGVGQGGREGGVRVGGGRRQLGEVAVVEAGVHAGRGELRVAQGADEEVAVGGGAVQGGLFQGAGQFAQRLGAGGGVGDRFREHRVVVDADLVTVGVAGVQADAVRYGEAVQGAGLRGPAAGGVLGVEAGLDRVAARGWGVQGEGVALGDADLFRDQVEAEHGLGDGVFDLEAGVHLQEVGPAVGDEELDGARTDVRDGTGGAYGLRVQLLDQPLGEAGCRGFLDHLLVPALE